VYTGKTDDGKTELALGEKLNLKLSEPYVGKYYCPYFDNYFCSITLLNNLLGKQLFGCGTLRAERKHYPKNIINQKRSTKCVSVASTIHNPSESSTASRRNNKGKKVSVQCPKMISCYNKYMGGVDLFDQYMSFYNINHKSRRWWMKIFLYLL
jgi:hypothetical protein